MKRSASVFRAPAAAVSTRRRLLGALAPLAVSATLGALAIPAQADDWPAKPVRIVVPFAAGGTTDISARIIAEQLSTVFKQSFVVENKAGAGGNIAAAEVARATPDGYTLLMGTPGTQSINQFLYPKLPYNPADLIPVSFVVRVPNVLMVHPSVPARSIQELLALAKAKPGSLTYGSPGNGSSGQLSTELMKADAKVFITHIPYRGSAPMLADLMAGQIQMSIDNLPAAINYIRAGKLVALGVTSSQPSDQLPGVPPIASVIPGYSAESWFVLVAPKGTPAPVVERLSAEVDKILKKPDVVERFRSLGATPVGGTPESLGKFIAAESLKWQKVVKISGAKVD